MTLLVAAALLAVLLAVAQARAGEPSTVTVRVEGVAGETLLARTQVTTNTAPIPAESGSCSGTSAGGALYDAIHGNWNVKYGSQGVEIDGIDGLSFPALATNPGVYWAFWLNNGYAKQGACGEEVTAGADIVFFPQCYEVGSHCSSATAPDHFLTSTAPTARVLNVGEPVSVTIGSINTGTGAPESSLPDGVSVSAGSVSASPNANGLATLSFPAAGTYTVQAHASDSVPSDPYTVCVHNGNDGTCGTTLASTASPTTVVGTPVAPPPYKGPFALVAAIKGLSDGHVYAPSTVPRILAGAVTAHGPVTSVSIRLRREYRRRCYAYDGVRERFRAARCGTGSFFRVASGGTFSYQLPSALRRGRYVLDVEASDAAGNRTELARGSSRIVFYVR